MIMRTDVTLQITATEKQSSRSFMCPTRDAYGRSGQSVLTGWIAFTYDPSHFSVLFQCILFINMFLEYYFKNILIYLYY